MSNRVVSRFTSPSSVRNGELALSARDVMVEVAETGARVVDGVSLDVKRGEIVGLAGESGCGKSTLALSLMGFARRGLRLAGGSVDLGGVSIFDLSERELLRVSGSKVSYVPQDPVTALNPAMKLRVQLDEMLTGHGFEGSSAERRERVLQSLKEVDLPDPKRILRSYPHQLSGGQQQRIGIAMAIVNRPDLVIMDEPTTGLDVSAQEHVLGTVREIAARNGVGILYVTHDLAVISELADRVLVMYGGRAAELGVTADVLRQPQHPYVAGLLNAVPDLEKRHSLLGIPGHAPEPGAPPARCHYVDRCPLAIDRCSQEAPPAHSVSTTHRAWCFRAGEVIVVERPVANRPHQGQDQSLLTVCGLSASYSKKEVLHNVDLSIAPGTSVALVGESGSGKTTLARCIGGLHAEFTGTIELAGEGLDPHARKRTQSQRRSIQYIFQNAYSALNPRRAVRESIATPLRQARPELSSGEVADRVESALETVSISPAVGVRHPHQLSGGQRQRVAIARALALEPSVLVCDEITSALDVSVQAVIVELLQELQAKSSLTMLFVTHNLALVPNIADTVAVMSDGAIVEYGPVDIVLGQPSAAQTKNLLQHIPRL